MEYGLMGFDVVPVSTWNVARDLFVVTEGTINGNYGFDNLKLVKKWTTKIVTIHTKSRSNSIQLRIIRSVNVGSLERQTEPHNNFIRVLKHVLDTHQTFFKRHVLVSIYVLSTVEKRDGKRKKVEVPMFYTISITPTLYSYILSIVNDVNIKREIEMFSHVFSETEENKRLKQKELDDMYNKIVKPLINNVSLEQSLPEQSLPRTLSVEFPDSRHG